MKKHLNPLAAGLAVALTTTAAYGADPTQPIASADVVFDEKDGILAIESEHFYKQTLTEQRAWYLSTTESIPDVKPDGDPGHAAGASGGAYIEALPDTRRTHADKLIHGENFSNVPGKIAILHYKVKVNKPGRYYGWVRAFSTTSEDNGLHFGLNGEWPESGQRWQTVKKHDWNWDCKQRTTKVHVGVPMQLWLDIDKAGEHELQIAMREDGIELDKFVLAMDKEFRPSGLGPMPVVAKGTAPDAFKYVEPNPKPKTQTSAPATPPATLTLSANDFIEGSDGYYLDRDKWLAINPDAHKSAQAQSAFPFPSGRYHLTLEAVGEEDGQSTYEVLVNDVSTGKFTCPLSKQQFEEGPAFHSTWKNIAIGSGDVITLRSQIASSDGQEYSRARIHRISFVAADDATKSAVAKMPKEEKPEAKVAKKNLEPLVMPREADGDGSVTISGELKQWHKVTVTLNGPYAHENDNAPNPFTDYALNVTFTHESGSPSYSVPGYFAADGNAANTSAKSGTHWRAHLSPDKAGSWNYSISFNKGKDVALGADGGKAAASFSGKKGTFTIAASDKSGRDFRSKGRLQYVGKHHLQFAGSGEYFLKAGADAPETMLAYADFDDTTAKSRKSPIKTWKPHVKDWSDGDPTWKDGKGKGLIGALNYLAGKGVNAFSFLPYNAGGDGNNIWPFVSRDEKFHYDCSKLDQWGIVFDHATMKGLYLHFKMQENEMDDDRRGQKGVGGGIPESLDGGKLGRERKLYCRELIARFGHALALNWNIGEENTQSTEEIVDMVKFIHDTDPYDHNIVIHTFPNQQEKVYTPLLGNKSLLTGASLQNHWDVVHQRTLQWLRASAKAGRLWVVANDEQGSANTGVPPDLGFEGFDGKLKDGKKVQTTDDIRKYTLWGNLMAGGAGVEYYFGYQLPQNDLICEDFRSRDQSWDYCRIALTFFKEQSIPFWEMANANALIGNERDDNSKFCFAKKGEAYLVYLPQGGTTHLDLTDDAGGSFSVQWFNPRTGGSLQDGSVTTLKSGTKNELGNAPSDAEQDWLIVVKKKA